MSKLRFRHLPTCLRMFVALSIFSGTLSVLAQTITWQLLPWPDNQNWPGSQGSPAVTNGDQIILTGQDVLSLQTFTAPLTITCDVVLPAKSTTDGTFELFFVPTGEKTNLLPNPDIELDMSESQSGDDYLDVQENHGALIPQGPIPYPIATQTVYHVSVVVAANRQVTWSINGQDVALTNLIVVPYAKFQLRLSTWQPPQVWQISNFNAFKVVPTGQFTYTFTNSPLWDVSGSYTNNTDTNDVVISTMDCQANGQITGLRSEAYVNGADHATGSGPITGKMFGRAGVVGASLKESEGLTGVSGGVAYTANVSGKAAMTVDPSSLTLLDSDSIRTCVVGGKCESLTETVSLPLPVGITGDWTLETDIAADGDNLTGTGTLTLSNGRVLSYQVVGSYNPASQLARLKLIGTGDTAGSSLSLTTQGTVMDITAVKGKVLGQTLTYP